MRRWGYAFTVRTPLASKIRAPKLGWAGWMPMPNHVTTISEPAIPARPSERLTMMMLLTFGKSWRKTMRWSMRRSHGPP